MAVIETWFAQDLKEPVKVHYLQGNVFSKDNGGNLIGVVVMDGEEAAVLQGTVSGSIIRADGATLTVPGTLYANECRIVLTQACYDIPGLLSVVIKLTNGSTVTTLCALTATVYQSETDSIVDPEHVVPSISELLAQIDACRTATTNANSATTAADTAADRADDAAAAIEDMTATATASEPGSAAGVTVSEVSGHYNLAFTIPRGATGPVDRITGTANEFAVSASYTTAPGSGWQTSPPNVPAGQYLWTRVRITFASGETIIFYSIARQGVDGTGSVSSVESISPDSNGNVSLDSLLAATAQVESDVDSIFAE